MAEYLVRLAHIVHVVRMKCTKHIEERPNNTNWRRMPVAWLPSIMNKATALR